MITKKLCFSLLVATAITVSSCKKNAVEILLNGNYEGTFQRQIGVTGAISNVTLTFAGYNFNGQSQSPKYPALCNGTYSIAVDSVTFNNACFFTADFDWSLILWGKYKIQIKNDSLYIYRDYNGIIFTRDIYKLKKQ